MSEAGAGWTRVGQKLERWADQDWRRNWQVPEEDRRRSTLARWDGKSYRYFRSPNVVCLEHYRKCCEALTDDA
jgi:hypothetical protein